MTESPTEITPQRLKRALAMPGRSQTALAKWLKLNASSVNRMVNGTRHIRASELPGIRTYLIETAGEARLDDYDNVPTEHRGAKLALKSLAIGLGEDFREVTSGLAVQVFNNLTLALQSVIPFATEELRLSFWQEALKSKAVLLALGRGVGILNDERQDELMLLIGVATAAFNSNEPDIETDPAVVEAQKAYMKSEFIEDRRSRRIWLAVRATKLALVVLEGPEQADIAIFEAARALERQLLALDGA